MRALSIIVFSLTHLLVNDVHAAERRFGDWSVGTSEDEGATFAATMNDSGSLFGEVCGIADKKCFWLLAYDVKCDLDDAKARYPILANTDRGATHLTLECLGPMSDGGTYRYRIVEWSTLEAVLKDSSRVGFALPLASDQFRVLRFSNDGRAEAAATAEAAAVKGKSGGTCATSVRDETL